MTHLEKFFAALYASEGWYIWFSERFDKPFSRRLYGRARAVVIFDRVMNDEIVTYPKMDVVGPCIYGSWPGGKYLKCEKSL